MVFQSLPVSEQGASSGHHPVSLVLKHQHTALGLEAGIWPRLTASCFNCSYTKSSAEQRHPISHRTERLSASGRSVLILSLSKMGSLSLCFVLCIMCLAIWPSCPMNKMDLLRYVRKPLLWQSSCIPLRNIEVQCQS